MIKRTAARFSWLYHRSGCHHDDLFLQY